MARPKQARFNSLFIGWLAGMIFPLIIFLLFYQIKYSQTDFTMFLKNIWQMKILLKLISLCVFPNLAFFFWFYQMKYDLAARGVIMATFIYAIVILAAKLI